MHPSRNGSIAAIWQDAHSRAMSLFPASPAQRAAFADTATYLTTGYRGQDTLGCPINGGHSNRAEAFALAERLVRFPRA